MRRSVEGAPSVERELRLWQLIGGGPRRWLAVRRDVCIAVETGEGLVELLGVVKLVNQVCELPSVAASGARNILKRLENFITARQRGMVTARRVSERDIALCRTAEARLDGGPKEETCAPPKE